MFKRDRECRRRHNHRRLLGSGPSQFHAPAHLQHPPVGREPWLGARLLGRLYVGPVWLGSHVRRHVPKSHGLAGHKRRKLCAAHIRDAHLTRLLRPVCKPEPLARAPRQHPHHIVHPRGVLQVRRGRHVHHRSDAQRFRARLAHRHRALGAGRPPGRYVGLRDAGTRPVGLERLRVLVARHGHALDAPRHPTRKCHRCVPVLLLGRRGPKCHPSHHRRRHPRHRNSRDGRQSVLDPWVEPVPRQQDGEPGPQLVPDRLLPPARTRNGQQHLHVPHDRRLQHPWDPLYHRRQRLLRDSQQRRRLERHHVEHDPDAQPDHQLHLACPRH